MKTTNYTPGPWIKDDGHVELLDQLMLLKNGLNTPNEWVCVGQPDSDYIEGVQNVIAICHHINAPLIASAPLLLSILAESLSYLPTNSPIQKKALQAIKQATV